MKVEELKGEKLDFWVAMAEGLSHPPMLQEMRPGCCLVKEQKEDEPNVSYWRAFEPSTDWSQGGPIIEREGIKLKGGIFEKWKADLKAPYHKYSMEGPTALVVAMRAFVASRFGVEVDDC